MRIPLLGASMSSPRFRILGTFIFGVFFFGPGGPAFADSDLDFFGAFTADNEVLSVDFSLSTDRNVTFFTSSWGGPDSGGGFDGALFLWDSNGDWLGLSVGYNDDGYMPGVHSSNGTDYSIGAYDVFLMADLAAGDYTATLVQTMNYPVNFDGASNLSQGFAFDAVPDFTRSVLNWGSDDFFNDATDSFGAPSRTGDYAFHILGVDGAVVPLPGTLMLGGIGFAVLGVRKRWAKK